MSRCLHRAKGSCPACRAFRRLLVAAVAERESCWRPGIVADLSRRAGRKA